MEQPIEISVPQQLLLLVLSLDGTLDKMPATALGYAIACSVLMELERLQYIDSDIENIMAIRSDSPAPKHLAMVHGEIVRKGTRQIRAWLDSVAELAPALRDSIMNNLVEAGIVEVEERKVFFLWSRTEYKLRESELAERMLERLRTILYSPEVPSVEEVRLVCIADAAGLLPSIVGQSEIRRLKPRIDILRRMDLVGQVMAAAIETVDFSIGISVRGK